MLSVCCIYSFFNDTFHCIWESAEYNRQKHIIIIDPYCIDLKLYHQVIMHLLISYWHTPMDFMMYKAKKIMMRKTLKKGRRGWYCVGTTLLCLFEVEQAQEEAVCVPNGTCTHWIQPWGLLTCPLFRGYISPPLHPMLPLSGQKCVLLWFTGYGLSRAITVVCREGMNILEKVYSLDNFSVLGSEGLLTLSVLHC